MAEEEKQPLVLILLRLPYRLLTLVLGLFGLVFNLPSLILLLAFQVFVSFCLFLRFGFWSHSQFLQHRTSSLRTISKRPLNCVCYFGFLDGFYLLP
jgi:hypothetical protein